MMEDKEGSSPTRGRVGNMGTRGGSPHRSQQRTNRAAYNNWAAQRRRAPTNASQPTANVTSPDAGQRRRGNRRAVINEIQSPERFSPESNGATSSSGGLNGIRELLDNIDAAIPDDSIISIHDDMPESNQASQTVTNSVNSSSPPANSFRGGGRLRTRRRLPLNLSQRGGSHGSRNVGTNFADPSSPTQLTPPQESPSPSANDISIASRRRRNIPPLRFRTANAIGDNLSGSSDDLSITDTQFAGSRPHNDPIQGNFNPYPQGLGTEDDPVEISPDTPDGPNSNSTGGGASSTRRRGTVRNRYGNARLRAATMGVPLESLASRSARRATLSPSPVLPPPGLLSDEELARRLQEEEWEAASVMSGEDDLDGGMLRSLESPLHLFGAGYHRRRPQIGLHLPPLSGIEDGNDLGSPDSNSTPVDANPFFFDGRSEPRRHRGMRGGRRSRYLSPIHQLSQLNLLSELRNHLPPNSSIMELLSSMVAPFEMESIINLESLDDANGGDYEALLALAERIGDVSRGLTQAEINKLPTRKHKMDSTSRNDGSSCAGATGGSSSQSEQQQCHICLSDYENGDQKRLLPCSHDFHKDCVDTWLKTNATCPVCRSEVKPKRS